MLIVGLTGSIGMGKSTAAACFRDRGIAVFDADAEVHRLYEGAAVASIEAAFPGTTAEGRVERAKLADALAGDPQGFARLERIVHPLVQAAERAFVRSEARRGASMAVLDIPLLCETGGDEKVDVVVVASASAATQTSRVMSRPGMTAQRLESLLARQISDAEKRRRADFVVDTEGSIAETRAQIDAIITVLRSREGQAFERDWA
ncbi:MAG TPA: dephospho-CoA kinase [Hyphomicrobiaceae bacterium]|nr:dephospho-CoA kinase [Hyphomicrobiaceae bacterium]